MDGEYESTSAIYAEVENFTPKPLEWGTFASNRDIHYYLCDFLDLESGAPSLASEFCEKVALLHMKSKSPNGKFGFDRPTYNGDLRQKNGWTDTWEESFRIAFSGMLELLRERTVGGCPEIMDLVPDMIAKVIPRLLKPMETGGRSIKPSLVHGDLWNGNTATISGTNSPVIYDPSSSYAHNECESKALAGSPSENLHKNFADVWN